MSVLVKGMEMPTECRKCPFNEFGTTSGETWCGVNDVTLAKNFEAINFDGRPEWCPLVALPDKHGRLVDAGECAEYFWEHLDDNGMAGAMNAINDMPTIVEAEDGE